MKKIMSELKAGKHKECGKVGVLHLQGVGHLSTDKACRNFY